METISVILAILLSSLLTLIVIRFYLTRTRHFFHLSATTFKEGADPIRQYQNYIYDLSKENALSHGQLETISKGAEPLVLLKEDEALIIVTDPVGQIKTGSISCNLAKKAIAKLYQNSLADTSPANFLKKACFLAHRQISEQLNANSGGCSIALIYIHRNRLYWASSGNIAIYSCYRELTQLNPLDLYKYQLKERVLQRKWKEDLLLHNRLKDELTAYLGHENLKKVNLGDGSYHPKPHDQLLIATKGVYETLSPLELEAILTGAGTTEKKIMELETAFFGKRLTNEYVKTVPVALLVSQFRKYKE